MPIVVTPGAADANSYATVAAADAYHLARGSTTWTGSDALKEAALIRATAWLDGRYGARWPGRRTYGRAQALDWPRIEAYDLEGEPILHTEIPAEVIDATCEAALRELVAPASLSPDFNPAQRVKRKRSKAGPAETETEFADSFDDPRPVLLSVDGILRGIVGSARTVRLVRA